MNYTEIARQEILQEIGGAASERKRRFLAALTKCVGSIGLRNRKFTVEYAFKDEASAMLTANLLKEAYGGEVECVFTAGAQPKAYTVRLGSDYANRALADFRLTHYEEDRLILVDGMPALEEATNREVAAEYLKGIFVGAGSLYLPDAEGSRGYCLELNLGEQTFTDQVIELLARCKLTYRKYERSNGYAAISKSGEQIADFLALIGANAAVMDVYDLIALKEVTNGINRQANVYAANLDKISKSNSETIAAIERLQTSGAWDALDDRQRKIARARLQNYEESLGDLARRLGMSKSTLSREFAKFRQIAEHGTSGLDGKNAESGEKE